MLSLFLLLNLLMTISARDLVSVGFRVVCIVSGCLLSAANVRLQVCILGVLPATLVCCTACTVVVTGTYDSFLRRA